MSKKNAIIVRQASDDFDAFVVANAMQSIEGVDVVSVVFQDCEPILAREPRGFWHVFAKFDKSTVTVEQIDERISKDLNQTGKR